MEVKIENRRTFWGAMLKNDNVVCLQFNQCSLLSIGEFLFLTEMGLQNTSTTNYKNT